MNERVNPAKIRNKLVFPVPFSPRIINTIAGVIDRFTAEKTGSKPLESPKFSPINVQDWYLFMGQPSKLVVVGDLGKVFEAFSQRKSIDECWSWWGG